MNTEQSQSRKIKPPPLCSICGVKISKRKYVRCWTCAGRGETAMTDAERKSRSRARYHARAHTDEFRAQRRKQRYERYRNDPEWRRKTLDYAKEFNRRKSFDLSSLEVDRLLEMQGNSCAICLSGDPGPKRSWSVDHDHSVVMPPGSRWKSVRGILCGGCNVWLGSLGDNLQNLTARRAEVLNVLTTYLTVTASETQQRLLDIKGATLVD